MMQSASTASFHVGDHWHCLHCTSSAFWGCINKSTIERIHFFKNIYYIFVCVCLFYLSSQNKFVFVFFSSQFFLFFSFFSPHL